MAHQVLIFFVGLALFSFMAGCSEHPSVSGKVTLNGEPLANILVVFSPVGGGDSADLGPISLAKTNGGGHFDMRTKDGVRGAAVGTHQVGFRWADVHHSSVESMKIAYKQVRRDAPEEAAKLREKIDELEEKLGSRPRLPENLKSQFEVTSDGTSEAHFELSDL